VSTEIGTPAACLAWSEASVTRLRAAEEEAAAAEEEEEEDDAPP
jgi:hypothetical protein